MVAFNGDCMPSLSTRAVAERLRELLPPDGTPVLNRVLRIMISRDFAQPISDDLYERARDQLSAAGQIGRLRGQGGQVFLAKGENRRTTEIEPAEARSRFPENALMPHLDRYLKGPFLKELDIPARGQSLVKDTSRLGPPLA